MFLQDHTAEAAREDLRALRYGKPLSGSLLMSTALVETHLAAEGVADSTQTREWAVGEVLRLVVAEELEAMRDGGRSGTATAGSPIGAARHAGSTPGRASSRPTASPGASTAPAESELALLQRDFQAGRQDLEAWALVAHYYLSLEPLQLQELAELLGLVEKTMQRRLAKGHALVAAALRAREIKAQAWLANARREREAAGSAAGEASAAATEVVGTVGVEDAAPVPLPAGTLTLLFTDIEGSTGLVQSLGAAPYAEALATVRGLLRRSVSDHAGRVVSAHGDAFFAVFPRAADGLAAAVAAQSALASETWSEGGAVRVRLGLHTGEPTLTDEDYIGVDVNRAARICDAANGGQVFVSAVTRALLVEDRGVTFRDLGEHRLKDLRFAERLFQVVAGGMPDVGTEPRAAGKVAARDRIVVMDPAAATDDPTRVDIRPTSLSLTVDETLAALDAVVRGESGTVVLTTDQVRAVARHRAADWRAYRLGRIAEWSQPRYRLDGRFVDLSLLVDQGESAAGERWTPRQERYDDLKALLAAEPDRALVLLGPPGSGKSTLLRRLELDVAIEGLRPDGADTKTFFVQLNQYGSALPDDALPAPGEWLAERWAARFPDLPGLETVLAEGSTVLLLDALNEMPRGGDAAYRHRVGLWKQFVIETLERYPGTRIVFSCRSLDYSAPLSTPALRVPQVQIEALSDDRVERFLALYSPAHAAAVMERLRDTRQLMVFRSPYFLKLLADQVERADRFPAGRAGLFTGLVRQSLRREIERGNPLFEPDTLLTERDYRRLVSAVEWPTPHDLPERGALVPRLGRLAYGMQVAEGAGGAQVRVPYDTALALIDHARDEDIIRAGQALAVLDEDPGRDEVLYFHQLVQEYFAAREMAKSPNVDLLRRPWRAADIHPSVPELLATLPPSETLPPLPQTGWEETALLAAAMAADADAFVRQVADANLALAGRCTDQVEVRERLSGPFLDELRHALVARSRNAEADLRERIACGLAVGELGDPRFERREGPFGMYLLPPLVEIPGGTYPIGEDEPIEWSAIEGGETNVDTDHMPRHEVRIESFRIGRFPVTNAEWRCFMEAGGYDDERWWDTEDARRWRRGEIANEGAKVNNRIWRRRFADDPALFDRMVEEDKFQSEEAAERWRGWLQLSDVEFEAALDAKWLPTRETEPESWRDARFSAAAQPVVGVCWYEARAYCNWLREQTRALVRLPTEVEWEAAARGIEGRRYPFGDHFDAARCNTFATRLRQTTPVGVFVEGDTPEGISDAAGNVYEWTTSLWGTYSGDESTLGFAYPYDAGDGRENLHAGAETARVVRGGSWLSGPPSARAARRDDGAPGGRDGDVGFRVVVAAPVS